MTKTAIFHPKIITPTKTIDPCLVLIADGRIVAIDETAAVKVAADVKILDAQGMVVAPGFIDAHTHGGNGHDFMASSPEEIDDTLRWMASTGTTGVLPTMTTSSLEDQTRTVKLLRDARDRKPPGAAILGLYLEGPYISHKKRGAQPERTIRPPSVAEMEQLKEQQ